MHLINLTHERVNVSNPKIQIDDVPQYLSATVKDGMYRVMDGEWKPEAVRHYIESVIPSYRSKGIILPFIKDKTFMSRIMSTFEGVSVWVWDSKELKTLRH